MARIAEKPGGFTVFASVVRVMLPRRLLSVMFVEAEFVGRWIPCENVRQFLREKSWRPPQEEGRLIVCCAALTRDVLGASIHFVCYTVSECAKE